MTNGTLEIYSRSVLLKLSNNDVFGTSEKNLSTFHCFNVSDDDSVSNTDDKSSFYRSKRSIERIVKLNHWNYFVTLTFSDQVSSPEQLLSKSLNRLKYLIKKNVLYRYCLVPELTKKGVLHFHGFLECDDSSMILSECVKVFGFESPIKLSSYKKYKKYQGREYIPVYNWYDWHFGWTVCYQVNDNLDNLIRYMLKYILKSENNKLFQTRSKSRRYFSGGDLNREVIKINFFNPMTSGLTYVPELTYKDQKIKLNKSTIPNTNTEIYYLEVPLDRLDILNNVILNSYDIQQFLKEYFK